MSGEPAAADPEWTAEDMQAPGPSGGGRAAPEVCIACGRRPVPAFALQGAQVLLRCPGCGLGWWNWPEFEPSGFYDRAYFQSSAAPRGYDDYAALEAAAGGTARTRLRRIARLGGHAAPGAPKRLLDVGCATGGFLSHAQRGGWSVTGVEVSRYGAAEAQRRGFNVRCVALEDLRTEPETLDCVTLWDVIEHLRDPAGVLQELARALRPGGVLALSTGDVTSLCAKLTRRRWHLFNLPEHLFFFSPRSLRILLDGCGLRVRRVVREVNWVPLHYVIERLRKTRAKNSPDSCDAESEAASERSDAAAPGRRSSWFGRLPIPATLFDVIGVYAVKG